MDIVSEIKELFKLEESKAVEVDDKISSFRLEFNSSRISVRKSNISDFIGSLPKEDLFNISLKIGENDSIIYQTISNNLSEFLDDLEAEIEIHENENIFFSLNCKKNLVYGRRYIYHFESFDKFWGQTKHIQLLQILKEDFEKFGFVYFEYLEKEKPVFQSDNLFWGYNPKEVNIKKYYNNATRENCHFGNYESLPFDPNVFNVKYESDSSLQILKKLYVFKGVFSITGIFDVTSISDVKLKFRLNGYKSYEGSIYLEELNKDYIDIYFKIYNWLYSEGGSISDKIGLTRNVLSIYLKEKSINISEEVFTSILSNYRTYLKENVSRYISLRNKIHDELSWISQKSSEVVDKYLSNFQKSILSFISFFASVFILRVLNSKEFSNVFTRETTILSFAFLLISLLFLIFSFWNLSQEKVRLERKYSNLKMRFTDLLIEKDIEQILNSDEEFKYEMSFINKRKTSYTILWIVTILIMLSAVLFLSDYLNFQIISDYLIQCPSTKK